MDNELNQKLDREFEEQLNSAKELIDQMNFAKGIFYEWLLTFSYRIRWINEYFIIRSKHMYQIFNSTL